LQGIETTCRRETPTDSEGWFGIWSIYLAEHAATIVLIFGALLVARRMTIRMTRYSQFDPDRWWETRAGSRILIIEFQKLVLDLALHPLS